MCEPETCKERTSVLVHGLHYVRGEGTCSLDSPLDLPPWVHVSETQARCGMGRLLLQQGGGLGVSLQWQQIFRNLGSMVHMGTWICAVVGVVCT